MIQTSEIQRIFLSMELTVQKYWLFHVQHGGILGLDREKHRENIAFLLFVTPS